MIDRMNLSTTKSPNVARDRDIVEMRQLGHTLEFIARPYGLTRERVRQIVAVAKRQAKGTQVGFDKLPYLSMTNWERRQAERVLINYWNETVMPLFSKPVTLDTMREVLIDINRKMGTLTTDALKRRD